MAKAAPLAYTAAQVLSSSFDPVANTIAISGGGSSTVDGSAFTASTDSGSPMEGVYESSPTTVANNKYGVIGIDSTRNVKVTQATMIAGEDLVNNLIKVEQRFSYSLVTADAAVKSGSGFLHTLTFSCNDAAPTAGSIIVYDNTAESGTQIFNHTFTTTPFVPFSLIIDASFATGLYVGFTTTADVNCTVSYR